MINLPPLKSCIGFAIALTLGFSSQIVNAQSVSKFRKVDKSIRNSYIVVFKDSIQRQDIPTLASRLISGRGRLGHLYQYALKGFSISAPESVAQAISQDDRVEYVEEDGVATTVATQNNPPWGLDRIDQRTLPLTRTYNYSNTGAGVNAYIIDTGILTTHPDFGGRALPAFDAVGDGWGNTDCDGHGTHVAGTVGSTTYGVAKRVTLYSVRVLGCDGRGYNSWVIAGVDWVTKNGIKPAVANMSLGGSASSSIDTSVRNSINSGISYVVAAGNEGQNASQSSPARVGEALTVGAVDINDYRALFSNFGAVLDLFAPGVDILSTSLNNSTAVLQGTSMASPHVAGAVALYLQNNPSASPTTVSQTIVNSATPNVVVNPGSGSPNRQLYSTPVSVPGDINGDGKSDLLWRNDNGTLIAWYMNGINMTGQAYLNPSGTSTDWKVVNTGDFNKDGQPDVLWRNDNGVLVVWYMNGVNQTGATYLNPSGTTLDWKVAGLADFNADGNLDILWRNDNGVLVVWYMNGVNQTGATYLNPSGTTPDWKVVGLADFNKDAKPDILWRNDNGTLVVWYMNGTTLMSSAYLNPSSTSTDWAITALADVNSDGNTDLIWRRTDGYLAYWIMNGINATSSGYFNPSQVDPSWKIVAPH